ncbi:hypothetical protein [Sphingorhabdus sp. 109]|jgi:glucose/arabinose dehydrogenase|uniref:hypothetical protein n=1 Tax=Sphingorhabdus sp. 109 TaxID=2653173 RepID=UPI0012F003A8|nr:hypothetical protein [Sphingorhabdus sp. 109]VWX57388.1 conserved exported hypothetical protein [Sphingorhabdus sp. 109]
MRALPLLGLSLLLLAACSETPMEEQGDEAIAEMEAEIEEDARSLEEAAAEAARVMAEDIDAELAADGVNDPVAVTETAAD